MIVAHWQPWFKQQYGGVLPMDYFCYDVETSGFSRTNDMILEWGHCLVRDGQPVDRISLFVNWYADNNVNPNYLDEQIRRVRRQMQLDGRSWHITPEILKTQGVEPKKFLPWLQELLTDVQTQKMLMVTQNGWNFDNHMIVSHLEDIGVKFEFDVKLVFDVGVIEKASQLLPDSRVLPIEGETLGAYFKRVNYIHAPGCKFNLDHCVRKYGLDIDTKSLHGACLDSYALHLLFEKFRVLSAKVETERLAQKLTAPVAVVPPRLAVRREPPPNEEYVDPIVSGRQSEQARLQKEMDAFDFSTGSQQARKPAAAPAKRVRGQRNR